MTQRRRVNRLPHRLFGHPDAERSVFANRSSGRQRPVDFSAVVDHVGDQPDPIGFVGIEDPAGEQEFGRSAGADQSGQEVAGSHIAVADADLDEDRTEASTPSGNPDVAGQRNGEAAADRCAVDRCDPWLARAVDRFVDRRDLILGHEPADDRTHALGTGRNARVAEKVGAGTEPATGAGQHDGP